MSTGVFIKIVKHVESDEWAIYRFCVPDGQPGILRICRETGLCELICATRDDSEETMLFARAAAKLRRHLRKGYLPDRTHWAN